MDCFCCLTFYMFSCLVSILVRYYFRTFPVCLRLLLAVDLWTIYMLSNFLFLFLSIILVKLITKSIKSIMFIRKQLLLLMPTNIYVIVSRILFFLIVCIYTKSLKCNVETSVIPNYSSSIQQSPLLITGTS